MAQFSQSEVIAEMERCGVVPLFFHGDKATARNILRACYQGGARFVEFTQRGQGAFDVFTELINYARAELPELMLGIGSIIDKSTTELYIEADADFIVSPILDEEMGAACSQHNIPWVPGCGTLTEIMNARKLGAEIVKVFPGSQLGPGFIKAVLGPCPDLKLMPTGGVTPSEENLGAWFSAGAVCVGMGSKLIKKEFIRNQQYQALQQHVADSFKLTQTIKDNS